MSHRDLRYIIDHWHWYEKWTKENKKNIDKILSISEPPFFVSGIVDNYSDLLIEYPNPVQFQFVYVENSQGTAWLPGGIGGTYYGAGLYMYNGTDWFLDKDEIHLALNDIYSNSFLYDGVENLESTILALDPTTYLGQTWWARDTKSTYYATTNIVGVDIWQSVQLKYDAPTDTFKISTTQDGQTQNLGQEVFFVAYNNNGTGATELDPKVFLATEAKDGEEVFQDVIKIVGGDLQDGSHFGINTTSLGVGEYGKIITYGHIRGVNTNLWTAGDLLYVDLNTQGELTDVKPIINGFIVGKVLKSHATEGIIFVNTINSHRIDEALIPIGITKAFFTADEEVTTEGTFFLSEVDNEGTILEDTVEISVPDNSIVASDKDHLSIVIPVVSSISAGIRDGAIEFEHDANGGQEKIHLEIYDADNQGIVIDSGILTNPIGDLGVRPVLIMSTSILDNDSNDIFKEEIRGLLEEDFSISADHRLRFHFLCEKIGTQGGTKDFTLYFGADHDSFLNSLTEIAIEDVAGLQDELDKTLKAGGLWSEKTHLINYLTREGTYSGYPLAETTEHLEPQISGQEEDSINRDTAFSTGSDTSVVKVVHKFTTTKDGFIKELALKVPTWDLDSVSRVTFIDVTKGISETIDNPILESNTFKTLVIGDKIEKAGYEFEIWLEYYNSSAASRITGGWTSNSGTGIPLSQEFNIDNLSNPSVIEINHTDLDSTNRSTELDGVIVGSILNILETGSVDRNIELEVTGVDTVSATSTKYNVTVISNGDKAIRDNKVCTINIDVPITQPSEYFYSTDYYLGSTNQPSWCNIETELYYGGVQQVSTTDGYGISVIWQGAYVSADWFIMSAK